MPTGCAVSCWIWATRRRRRRSSSSRTAFSTFAGVRARAHLRHDVELARDLAGVERRRDARRDLLVIHQPLVEPRRLAGREHVGREAEQVGVGRTPLRHVPHHVDPRLRHAVLHDLALFAGPLGNPGLVLGDGRSRDRCRRRARSRSTSTGGLSGTWPRPSPGPPFRKARSRLGASRSARRRVVRPAWPG